jgi:cation transport regulator ChaC
MTGDVGILAYGSLLEHPGEEIEKATVRVVSSVKTPFKVEFARSSGKRSGAPTLVPDDRGGNVDARIFVVDLSVAEATNRLYRRELNEVGSGLAYKEPKRVMANTVVIKSLPNFGGVETVLYTHISANIEPLTAGKLAELAIRSARERGDNRDGITYLIDAARHGIETPLGKAYAAEIMRALGAPNLTDALAQARAQGREVINRAVTVLSAVIWHIHLKRVMHATDPAPRLNFWRLIYGDLMDMAVIEWCKLFGSDHEVHQPVHWKNILPEDRHEAFRTGLLAHLRVSQEDWLRYREGMKHYRDNHAAHMSAPWLRPDPKDKALPEDRYPELGMALEAAYFYYRALIARLADGGIDRRYPPDIGEYCERYVAQATEAARKALAATADMEEKVF